MKHIIKFSLLLVMSFGLVMPSFAQKTKKGKKSKAEKTTKAVKGTKAAKGGSISYEAVDVKGGDGQAAMMIKGMTQTLHTNGDETVAEISMMGGMLTQKVFNLNDQQFMLMDGMMGKMKVVMDEAPESEVTEGLKAEIFKTETKEILGYECYKVMVKGAEGDAITAYVTEEVSVPSQMLEQVEGLEKVTPMYMEVPAGDMTIILEAKSVSTDVSDIFGMDTSGYKELTQKEFEEQFGEMGGGLGF